MSGINFGRQTQGILVPSSIHINARDFGAKGNGVDDDTTAIQSAIDFCNARGGGIVTAPLPGKYLFSNLIVKPYVTLQMDVLDADYTATDNSLPADDLLNYCLFRKSGSTGVAITVQEKGYLHNVNINGNNVAGRCVDAYGDVDGLTVVRSEDALHIYNTCDLLDNFYLYGNTGNALTINSGVADTRISRFNIASNLGYGLL